MAQCEAIGNGYSTRVETNRHGVGWPEPRPEENRHQVQVLQSGAQRAAPLSGGVAGCSSSPRPRRIEGGDGRQVEVWGVGLEGRRGKEAKERRAEKKDKRKAQHRRGRLGLNLSNRHLADEVLDRMLVDGVLRAAGRRHLPVLRAPTPRRISVD